MSEQDTERPATGDVDVAALRARVEKMVWTMNWTALDPAVVLALLDRLAQAEADLAVARGVAEQQTEWGTAWQEEEWLARQRAEQAEARVEALENFGIQMRRALEVVMRGLLVPGVALWYRESNMDRQIGGAMMAWDAALAQSATPARVEGVEE